MEWNGIVESGKGGKNVGGGLGEIWYMTESPQFHPGFRWLGFLKPQAWPKLPLTRAAEVQFSSIFFSVTIEAITKL